MRITIDTGYTPNDKHHIKIHGEYTLDELIKFLSKYYPDFTWKDVIVCEELPKINEGLWKQIEESTKRQYVPAIPSQPFNVPSIWPGSGSNPYVGDTIIYGTGYTAPSTFTSKSEALFDAKDTMGIHKK